MFLNLMSMLWHLAMNGMFHVYENNTFFAKTQEINPILSATWTGQWVGFQIIPNDSKWQSLVML